MDPGEALSTFPLATAEGRVQSLRRRLRLRLKRKVAAATRRGHESGTGSEVMISFVASSKQLAPSLARIITHNQPPRAVGIQAEGACQSADDSLETQRVAVKGFLRLPAACERSKTRDDRLSRGVGE